MNAPIFRIVRFLSIGFTCVCISVAGIMPSDVSAEESMLREERKAWWKTARGRMESVLAAQGRTPIDIESPKWYEVRYNTVGRMPLIDTCLREPLVMPEVALWADERAREAGGSLRRLFDLAFRLAGETGEDPPGSDTKGNSPEWLGAVRREMEASSLPPGIVDATIDLLGAIALSASLRDSAFAALTDGERDRVTTLLPGYFVRRTPAGETVRGYTAEIDDCVELIGLLRKVDFARLTLAAAVMAGAADDAGTRFGAISVPDVFREPGSGEEPSPLIYDTPVGRVAVGGPGDDVYSDEYALMIDLGGDDLYLNHPASTSLEGCGAAVHVDVSGDDSYRSGDFSQGSALTGISVFMDLEGDDCYTSGHYSQGAALGGFAFFYEGGGDDVYVGDFGVQCFALFGYSVFLERSGRDTYRCAAMGQGSASTLGVAILAEAGGDDLYRAGGKYGFYSNYDSSCAQGAASGMRPWPPTHKITVYGGIGFLSEAGGNDCYNAYIIGQGGSYIFALGMLVDSEGIDTYISERYCRGVGVHLSAAVALDLAGDDLHNGVYGNTGYSLDRCSGVFVDFAGNDTYRTTGGIGFGHKPKGCGIFVDVSGDDTYAGWENNYGKADWPFGDEAYSTGFFLDFGGDDRYPGGLYRNDAAWAEGSFGYGADARLESPGDGGGEWWAPTAVAIAAYPVSLGPRAARIAEILGSVSPLVHMTALDPEKGTTGELMTAIVETSRHSDRPQRRHLIDLVQFMITKEIMDRDLCMGLAPLLEAEDYDLRLLALNAFRHFETDDAAVLSIAARLAGKDPSWEVRSMACLTLGASGRESVLEPLRKALGDENPLVRRRAAIALGELKHEDSYGPLLSALAGDGAFQVRGYAAKALGELKREDAIPSIERALKEENEFVRCMAARTLLVDFLREDAIVEVIALLDWPNHPMRNQWVAEFLTDYTGQSLPADRDSWTSWWNEASSGFDPDLHARIYEQLEEARKLKSKGEEEEALALFREMHGEKPDHGGIAKDLSDMLNSISWGLAVMGEDIERGLELAQESVAARANAMNIDTLAVLYYLNGDKPAAQRTLLEAMEGADENERGQYERRLEEFRTGELVL